MGVGFEMELGKIEYDAETKESFHWLERYLVVRSDALAHRQQKSDAARSWRFPPLAVASRSLHQRLDKAEQVLSKLAAKLHPDCCNLQTKVQSILKRYRVQDYFLTEIDSETVTRYAGPGRPSHKAPNRTIVSTMVPVEI